MGIAQIWLSFDKLHEVLGLPENVEITHVTGGYKERLQVHIKSEGISNDNPAGWGSMIIPLDEVQKIQG